MSDKLHIPWSKEGLKNLMLKIILLGESEKIDLKSAFELSDALKKQELAKDVAAIANTRGDSYEGFGFLIFGAEPEKGLVYTNLSDTQDKLQAQIDDCIKSCLTPFIRTHFFIFEDDGSKWGVLAIAPSRDLPHVLIKGFSDSVRGDVFVRLGSTTEKAGPSDYARFFNYRIEDATYELREDHKSFTLDLARLREQLRDLNNEQEKKSKTDGKPETLEKNVSIHKSEQEYNSDNFEFETLSETIERVLSKRHDPIEAGLIRQALHMKNLLEKNHISWELHSLDKQGVENILSEIEAYASEYWRSLFLLTAYGESSKFEVAIVKSLQIIATKSEAPVNIPFTEFGRAIRYLPLFVSMYIVFIGCTYSRNPELLKKILKIELRGRTSYDVSVPLPFVLIYARAVEDFLKPLHPNYPKQTWIDPCAAYVQNLLKRILVWDDPFWDFDHEFFRGEFILCLSPLDFPDLDGVRPLLYPIQGAYLHFNDAINPIKKMLNSERVLLEKTFIHPLKPILEKFDEVGGQMGNRYGGFGGGFTYGATKAAYPESGKEIDKI